MTGGKVGTRGGAAGRLIALGLAAAFFTLVAAGMVVSLVWLRVEYHTFAQRFAEPSAVPSDVPGSPWRDAPLVLTVLVGSLAGAALSAGGLAHALRAGRAQ